MNYRNNNPAQMPPELQEMAYQSWLRTPEQQQDEEELMMIELIRSYPPEMRSRIEHDYAYGKWEQSKPRNYPAPF